MTTSGNEMQAPTRFQANMWGLVSSGASIVILRLAKSGDVTFLSLRVLFVVGGGACGTQGV